MARIFCTGDTLQLGELEHHFRHQVALAQRGRSDRGRLVGADRVCQLFGDSDDAVGLVQQASQMVLKHDAAQPLLS